MNVTKIKEIFKSREALMKAAGTTFALGFVMLGVAVVGMSVQGQKDKARISKEREETTKEMLALKANYDKIINELTATRSDFGKMQSAQQAIVAERDKLSVENKALLEEAAKIKDLENALANTKKDMDVLEKEKQDFLSQNLSVKDQVKDLESIQRQLIAEKENLEASLRKETDKTSVKKIEEENSSLKKTNADLSKDLKLTDAQARQAREHEAALKSQVDKLNNGIDDLNKKYADAVKKNREFEQKVNQSPAKFAEIAHQNKVLMKQTSNMHYNLGVFYTQHKDYNRATAEFERALELRPDDAYANFNLGYIYSEYLVNRKKAVHYFQNYLRYARKDDKDVDWVKRYLITWQTYEAKEPM